MKLFPMLINYQIRRDLKATNYISMDKGKLRDLKIALHSVRQQAALCGKYLAPTQLLSIMLSIWFASSTVYISLMFLIEGNSDNYVLAWHMSFFNVFSMYRVYVKIRMGVRITSEVHKSYRN